MQDHTNFAYLQTYQSTDPDFLDPEFVVSKFYDPVLLVPECVSDSRFT